MRTALATIDPTPRTLTPRQQRFVEEYLIDLNATQAAIRAGYSPKTAYSIGHENLRKPEIEAAIAYAVFERSQKTGITAERVLEELWDIATADPNELVEFRRINCRYCYGLGHEYQFTAKELKRERQAWEKEREKNPHFPLFSEQGGPGYDRKRPPAPDCPECYGEGEGEAFFKDSARASGKARKLYAGVKETKDGLEIKLHDKVTALKLVGQHCGVFREDPEGGDNRPKPGTQVFIYAGQRIVL
jgi:phage terminase small subunit